MKRLGTLLLLLTLSACFSEPCPPDQPHGPADAESPATPATIVEALPTSARQVWSVKLRPHGRPVPAGDAVIAVVDARDDELDIVALDRATGAELWRRPFLTTSNEQGLWLGDLVYESRSGAEYVVFQLARTGPGLARSRPAPFVAVDPATGEVVSKTRPVTSAYGPVRCDDRFDACLRINDRNKMARTRWELGTWKLRPEESRVPDGTNAASPEGELYVRNGSVDGYVAATEIGRAGPGGWRIPARRLLEDRTWLMSYDVTRFNSEAGILVMNTWQKVSSQQVRRYNAGREVTVDPSRRQTIGIDNETGDVVWRHDGSKIDCLELTWGESPVRCAFAGDIVHRKAWDNPRLRGATATLQGYDPATGETTWSHELSRQSVAMLLLRANEMDAKIDPYLDAEELMVVPTRSGLMLVSLVDGSARPVGRDEPLPCLVKVLQPYAIDERTTYNFIGIEQRTRRVVEPCTAAEGKAPRIPLGATAVLTGGVDAGEGIWAVARFDAIVAYELS